MKGDSHGGGGSLVGTKGKDAARVEVTASGGGTLDDFIPYHLRRIIARVDEIVAADLREAGLNREQWRVLMVIRQFGPQSLTSLAEGVSINTSTLSRLIDRMAADDMVERSASGDGRAIRISATDRGLALVAKVDPLFADLQRAVSAAFAPADLARLMADLDRLHDAYGDFAEARQRP